MINKIFNNSYLCLLFILLLLALSIPFQKKIDNERSNFRSIENIVLLSPKTLKIMSLGFDNLVADIYWLRAVQYFGNPEIPKNLKDPELVYKYFDIITELDPKFVNAYRYGGTFISDPLPFGLNRLDIGTNLFDKGQINNPDNFRIPLEHGFQYFFYSDNKEKASELFKEASEKPNLKEKRRASIKGMAASALDKGGNRELSKKIWQEIHDSTQNEGRRNFALLNLKELNTKDLEDKLTGFANKYEETYGSFPKNVEELLILKEVKKIPKDHEGLVFYIDPETKTVKSTALNKHLISTKAEDSK